MIIINTSFAIIKYFYILFSIFEFNNSYLTRYFSKLYNSIILDYYLIAPNYFLINNKNLLLFLLNLKKNY